MSDFPRIDVTVDAVVFAWANEALFVLLIQRKKYPYEGEWAFPGGFIDEGEHPDDAVKREVHEETGLELKDFQQFYTFGDPNRDPRKRIMSVAYFALLNNDKPKPIADDDAADAKWYPLFDLPKLAFDHEEMLDRAAMALHDELKLERMESSHPDLLLDTLTKFLFKF